MRSLVAIIVVMLIVVLVAPAVNAKGDNRAPNNPGGPKGPNDRDGPKGPNDRESPKDPDPLLVCKGMPTNEVDRDVARAYLGWVVEVATGERVLGPFPMQEDCRAAARLLNGARPNRFGCLDEERN